MTNYKAKKNLRSFLTENNLKKIKFIHTKQNIWKLLNGEQSQKNKVHSYQTKYLVMKSYNLFEILRIS